MKRMNLKNTTKLFAVPSFLRGMASTLDIGSTLSVFNESASPSQADYKALCSDWAAVGDDFRSAISEFEDEE